MIHFVQLLINIDSRHAIAGCGAIAWQPAHARGAITK